MWGDGKQTRSFCYVDDAVEGLLRIMTSAYTQPLNLGSDEMVSMNDMAEMSMDIAGEGLCNCAKWTLTECIDVKSFHNMFVQLHISVT